MKKKITHKILAVGASLLMLTSAMAYLQGCGSDNNDPTIIGTNNPPADNNNPPAAGLVTTTTNVFLDEIVGDLDYFFIHGSTSTDNSKFLVSFNENKAVGEPATSQLYMMDADSIAAASPSLASSGTTSAAITGTTVVADGGGKPVFSTISFRSTWTQDDSKIMLAGADRFYVINAATLAVENGDGEGDATIGGQNHDALPTTDGKYALLTLRTKPYATANMDGEIQLYDVVKGEPIGSPVSVCNACHTAPNSERNAILCGLDGELALVPGTAPGYGGGEATPDTYEGTVYIAGHGAHFAKVDLVIDPSNTTDPIATLTPWSNLNRIQVAPTGAPASDYMLHDARIDGTDIYWSTYMKDQFGYLHYGKLDLTNSTVTADISYAPDCRALEAGGGSFYCASGQTDTHYMPITMTNEGYISVIPKVDVDGLAPLTAAPDACPAPGTPGVTEATNVFMDGIVGALDYFFIHGSTSTDNSKFLVSFNENKAEGESATSQLYMMDADSIAAATPALASSGTTQAAITGTTVGPAGPTTVSFRSTWTQDDSKIMLAGADRFYVLNANTLAVENGDGEGDATIGGLNHDALPTTDGKYALLTLRTKPYATANMDGEIQLYDVVNGEPIGSPVSVCNACHAAPNSERSAILCGLDGSIVADGDGTYSGTVYVAGHGAHFAKVTLDIDPSNTTDPIAALTPWSTLNRIQVAPSGAPASDYLLHDARIDGTDMYWSTYMLDANGELHYGKVNLTDGTVTADLTIAPDARATSGTSFYCASGQTDTHFMPITMTNEGYITVIPKDTIVAP